MKRVISDIANDCYRLEEGVASNCRGAGCRLHTFSYFFLFTQLIWHGVGYYEIRDAGMHPASFQHPMAKRPTVNCFASTIAVFVPSVPVCSSLSQSTLVRSFVFPARRSIILFHGRDLTCCVQRPTSKWVMRTKPQWIKQSIGAILRLWLCYQKKLGVIFARPQLLWKDPRSGLE